jgi:ABC-type Fe3+ transport system substrate-binding protein
MSEFEAARNTKTIVIAVVVIAIIGVGGIAGWMLMSGGLPPTNGTTTPTATGNVLTVITRHDVAILNVYEPAFLATDFAINNGITDINWKTPFGEYWDDLISLGQIDVLWGGGPTLFDQMMRDGYLEPLTSSTMDTVLARVNDTLAGSDMKRFDGGDPVWCAAAISSFGFTVNHAFLDSYSLPTPTTWTALADPIYGSLLPSIPTIAMGNAPDTTSNTRIYEIMTQGLGWDEGWINMARMAGSSNIYGGSVETQAAAEGGSVGISMSIDFYGYISMSKNPDCEYIAPEGQTFVNGDPIAIASTSSHKDWAEGFVDFILSAEGQSLWLDENIRRMPVMREAFDTPIGQDNQDMYQTYNNTVQTVGIDFNDTLSLLMNSAFTSYFESVFTNSHTELKTAWNAILDAYENSDINETMLDYFAGLMGTPVTIVDPKTSTSEQFTPEYAVAINNDMIYDAAYHSQVQTLWTNAAKAQYSSVIAELTAFIAP